MVTAESLHNEAYDKVVKIDNMIRHFRIISFFYSRPLLKKILRKSFDRLTLFHCRANRQQTNAMKANDEDLGLFSPGFALELGIRARMINTA